MKYFIKNTSLMLVAAILFLNGCKEKEFSMGSLAAPTNLVINTEVQGQDATHPDGDGSGNVKISVSADGALVYKIDYDAADPLDLVEVPTGSVTKKFTKVGVNTYRLTLVVYGKGGSSSSITKEVTVRSDFAPADAIVASLTGGASKTWKVNKDVSGHFGVGPFGGSSVPEWWSAGINEKVACCNCFYTATYTFTKTGSNYTLAVATPDGAFTKTGSLTTLPGIPGSGDEGCYSYGGGNSAFSFVPASSGIAASNSTQTSIQLAGNDTFIGYGAVQKEFEILEISDTRMYLRVQGTETGNAWYMILIPVN